MMNQLEGDETSPVLHLNYCGITDVGEIEDVREYPEKIKYLYLKRNRLQSLSLVIIQLSNLLQIHLEGNNLESLPEDIGQLKHLEVLNVVSNRLTSLPVSVGELLSLHTLQVCNNDIVSLPKELGILQSLETLEATRNQLSSIPNELCWCTKLRLLALDKNFIRQCPRQLCWLPNLTDLSLAGNCLEYLPPVTFRMLTRLQCINVENNPGVKAIPRQNVSSQIIHFNIPIMRSRGGLCMNIQYLKVNNEYFAMPQEFNQLCVPNTNCVPCLEELAMRVVHRNLKHTFDHFIILYGRFSNHNMTDAQQLSIPAEATDHLMYPTAYCLHCDKCIYKSGFPVIYLEPGCSLPTLEFCCSHTCVLTHNFQGCQVKYPLSISQ